MTAASSSTAPVVICVAPNGARRTHADHPALPLRPHELAAEAVACAEAGAGVMHLHVRDDAGAHSLDVQRYALAMVAIRSAVGDRLLLQVTTEAVGLYGPPAQMAVVRELRPDAASVALRELVPDDAAEPEAARFFAWARDVGVALQFIVYDAADARRLAALVRSGVVPHAAPNTLFVLGRYSAGQRSAPLDLLPFLNERPHDWPWSLCAFGTTEAQCMAAAIGLGGHARVGFENNLQRTDGRLASGNAELVANVALLARASGRGVADAAQARALYGARPL